MRMVSRILLRDRWPSASRSAAAGRPRSLVAVLLASIVPVLLGCSTVSPVSPTPGGSRAARPQADESRLDRQILVTVVPRDSWETVRAGTSSKAYAARYRVSARTRKVIGSLAADYRLTEVEGWPMRPLGIHCVVFELAEGASLEDTLERLAADRRVESVEPMQVFAVESAAYNDPYLGLQHGVDEMHVLEAQRWSRGEGVRIAIVDTGVDVTHPELSGHIRWTGDFVGREGEPEVPPDHHGTAVAGVIVASVDNGIGIVGVAPSAELLVLRACWERSPDERRGICSSFTLAKALVAAIERRPDVLNLSLAGPSDPLLQRLLTVAVERGIVVVAARGDRAEDLFPAGVGGVVAVGAPREPEGIGAVGGPRLRTLLAPGDEILTTTPGGGFDFVSGHSLAAAHVSGIAALLLARRPHLTGEQLDRLLRETSSHVSASGTGGPGVVDACDALARLIDVPRCGG